MHTLKVVCFWIVVVFAIEAGLVALLGTPIFARVLPAQMMRIFAIVAAAAAGYLAFRKLTKTAKKK